MGPDRELRFRAALLGPFAWNVVGARRAGNLIVDALEDGRRSIVNVEVPTREDGDALFARFENCGYAGAYFGVTVGVTTGTFWRWYATTEVYQYRKSRSIFLLSTLATPSEPTA